MWWTSNSRHSLDSEISDRTVSRRFIRPWGGKILKELWGRPTKNAYSGTSLWQIPYTNNICLLEDKIQKLRYVLVHNFLRKQCYGSKKWRSLNQLMIRSSRSNKGSHGPNFELLDARIASALNNIIQNTRFKKKVSLEEMKAHKEDSFFRGRQTAYLIYECFRVTGANDSVENYADLFAVVLRNDDIQEFDSKWDEIL